MASWKVPRVPAALASLQGWLEVRIMTASFSLGRWRINMPSWQDRLFIPHHLIIGA